MSFYIFYKNLQGTQLALETQFEEQTANCHLAEAVVQHEPAVPQPA